MQGIESVEPWYKQFWPWFIIALPVSVVIAGVVTVLIAVFNEDSLVVNNYYRDGLAINRELHLEKNASLLKIKAQIYFDKKASSLRVVIDGRFQIMPERVLLLLSHPADQKKDQLLMLERGMDNDYFLSLQHALQGRWYIRLSDYQRKLWRLNTQIDLNGSRQVSVGYHAGNIRVL